MNIAREVNKSEIGDIIGIDSQVDGVIRDCFGVRHGKVEVREGTLNIGKVRNLSESQSGKLAVLDRRLVIGRWSMDESQFDGSPSHHIVAPRDTRDLIQSNRCEKKRFTWVETRGQQ